MNPLALTQPELARLIERGLVRYRNPELPLFDDRGKPKRTYKNITPAQCNARRRAEERGEDTSRWPARVRPGVVRERNRIAAMKEYRVVVMARNRYRRKRGLPLDPVPEVVG